MELLQTQPNGVYTIDSGYLRPGFDAIHLIEDGGEVALVDTGTKDSVPRVLAALDQLGLERRQVSHVILTHIHLDHAGGAGLLMQELPEAICLVDPRGERHMLDPSKLEAGARAVYGDAVFDEHYGSLVPVPSERLRSVADGETLMLGRRRLAFHHTEGHAKHHISIQDAAHGAVFAGDSFGVSYPALDTDSGPFVFPTTTPVHFDPDAAHESVDRIAAMATEAVYLTHYSRRESVSMMAEQLHRDLDSFAAITDAMSGDEQAIADEMRRYLEARMDAHGVPGDIHLRETWVALDVKLNAQGLAHWYAHR